MGDLISRSALIAKIKPPTEDDYDHTVSLGNVRKMLLNFANSVPSVDAVKVVHGRWIGSYDFCCSACGVYQNLYTGRTKFCPNCGARMDGDGNG